MTRTVRTIVWITAAIVLAGAAHADLRPYVQLQIGPTFGHDSEVSDRRGPVNGKFRFEHGGIDDPGDLGFNGGAAVGLHIDKSEKHSFRAELQGNYDRVEIKKLVVDGQTLARGGNMSLTTFLANGYYEHDFGDLAWVRAFIGGGVGVGFVDFGQGTGRSTVLIDDSSTEFAWNLTAGVVLPLGDHVDLTAAYRYLRTTEAELDAVNVNPAIGPRFGVVDAEVHVHDFLLGVRFTF